MEDTVVPVDIPNTLLQKARIMNKDTIGFKYDFVKHKGNEFIQVEPPSAKFMGYEINKSNSIKIKVVNKATISQRIHVLPLESNTFSIQTNKKGLVPTGMAEEITISFKPTEYKYYYDTLRINTETENILVPIHAFPVLDRNNLRNVFPRLIDFGTILIGSTSTITQQLSCKIPINFEFEFVFQKDHSDMRILPQKGIIPGNGQIEININYSASTNTTVICEAEFDFEPLKIRFMGSGRFEDPAQNKRRQIPQSAHIKRPPSNNNKLKKLDRSIENSEQVGGGGQKKTEFLLELTNKQPISELQLKQLLGPKVKSEQTQLNNPEEKLNSSIKSGNSDRAFKVRSVRNVQSAIVTSKNRAQSALTQTQIQEEENDQKATVRNLQERDFLEKCNAIQLMDKSKDIKFFQCIGDEQQTPFEKESVEEERKNFHQSTLDSTQDEGIHRYSKKINSDYVMIGEKDQEIDNQCSWDTDKNDNLKLRKIILTRFMKAGTRIILKIRMVNRLIKLKNLVSDCKSKQDAKKIVAEDWQKAEYAGVGKKEFATFEFDYNDEVVENNLFPIQYEVSNNLHEFKFDVAPRKDFIDLDLHSYTLLPKNEVEAMKYSNFDRPLFPNYPSIETDRELRTGAEWEYPFNGRTGAFKELKETPGATQQMAITYLKPLEMPSHLFITSHNTLRPFVPLNEFSEVDSDYYLQPEYQEIQDCLDPKANGEFFALKNEFVGKTPGLSSRFALHSIYSENTRYIPSILSLPKDCGNIPKSEISCPSSLKKVEYNDNLTDDDSDGDANPTLQVTKEKKKNEIQGICIYYQIQSAEDFLKQLEDKDPVITSIRQKNSERLPFDEYSHVSDSVNNNLHLVKMRWISTLPSQTDSLNKNIQYRKDKAIIL